MHTGTEFSSCPGWFQPAEINTGYGHCEQPSVCFSRESSRPPPNFPKLLKQKKETSKPPTNEEVKQWKALLRHLTGNWCIFSKYWMCNSFEGGHAIHCRIFYFVFPLWNRNWFGFCGGFFVSLTLTSKFLSATKCPLMFPIVITSLTWSVPESAMF